MEVGKRKLLFFCSKLEGGGAEKHLVRVLNKTDFQKFEIHLALSRSGGAYEVELDDRVIKHYLTSSSSSTASLFKSYFPLKKLIGGLSPDLVISMLDRQNIILSLLKKNSRSFPKTILCCQNAVSKSLEDSGIIGKVFRRSVPKLYNRNTAIVALSEGVKEELQEDFSIRIPVKVIYNAGFDEQIEELASQPSAIPAYSDEVTYLVAAGRFTRQKGFDVLIRSLSLIESTTPYHLLLLGTGADKEALKDLAKEVGVLDKISFMGFQKNPYPYFKAAKIFVLSSRWEGFGNVITEAMRCKCAVVSTDCNFGPGEIISHGTNGLLVPVEDERLLALNISSLINDNSKRQKLAEAGYKRASEYLPEKISGFYYNYFNEVINQVKQ